MRGLAFTMGALSRAIMVVVLICGCLAEDDDGWNFSPQKGVRTKENAAMLTLAASFNDTAQDPRVSSWWASYKQAFYKDYPNDVTEHKALANFRSSIDKIGAVNSDLAVPYWLSGNEYSDLGFEEFKLIYLMTNFSLPRNPSGRRLRGTGPVSAGIKRRRLTASSVDWRSDGRVTPVKNQGSCGSCWAYAATGVIESAYLLAQGLTSQQAKLDLSEQQLIDCVGSGSSCGGGSADSAIRYVNNVYQTTEDLYPSTYTDGSCKAYGNPAAGAAVQLASGTIYPGTWSESALMDAVARQPTVIYYEVVNDFYSYAGGTYYPRNCGTSINHAMIVVGYQWNGDSSSSYWIVRNSWGSSWGVYGYAYIAMTGDGAGPCGMYQYVFQVPTQFSKVLSSNQQGSPPPTKPNSSPPPPSIKSSPPPYKAPSQPGAPPYKAPSAPNDIFGWTPFSPWAPFGWSAQSPPPMRQQAPPTQPLSKGTASPPPRRLRRST